jgi:hypothetical protein
VKKKQKLDHPILRKLIKVFAPGHNLSRNPCKKADRIKIIPPEQKEADHGL